MHKDLAKEKWKEICFILSENVSPNINERDFENQVIRAIEILGWSEFKGELEKQPTIQIGRQGSLRPDLVIKSNEGTTLIVIEIKKPAEDLIKEESISQLKSYMRQCKTDFGFLIGKELRVYYDGDLKPQDEPLLLEKISFDRTLTLGWEFVENFNKEDFIGKNYSSYLKSKIGKFNARRLVEKLKEILLSEKTEEKIVKFLENEFAIDYGQQIFSSAIDDLSIKIQPKNILPLILETPKGNKITSHQKKYSNKIRPVNPIGQRSMKIDRQSFGFRYFCEILVITAEWLVAKRCLSKDNCPIVGGRTRNLVNTEPKHRDSKSFTAPRKLSNGLYIETHGSATTCKRNACKLLQKCGFAESLLEVI